MVKFVKAKQARHNFFHQVNARYNGICPKAAIQVARDNVGHTIMIEPPTRLPTGDTRMESFMGRTRVRRVPDRYNKPPRWNGRSAARTKRKWK